MLEPARSVIAKFRGPTNVAKIVGVHRTRVSNWMRPRSKGGTGGLVPQTHHLKLLNYAAASGIPLNADDFLLPRDLSFAPITPAHPEVAGAAS